MKKAAISEAILGSESNPVLLAQLKSAAIAIGGTMSEASYGVGGSQEIITYRIDLPGGQLTAISETYIGLSLTGPIQLVEQLCTRLAPNNSAELSIAPSVSTPSA